MRLATRIRGERALALEAAWFSVFFAVQVLLEEMCDECDDR
jgi:hypothetical protein